MMFLVQQIANRENCLCDGYAQGFEAYKFDDNSQIFAGAHYEEGFDNRAALVQTKTIEAKTPTEAIKRFKQWLNGAI
jgi:hypothetical protein